MFIVFITVTKRGRITLITVKMALLVLLSIVFLWSEVLSQCPPSSGKSLDVYSNNCIGFYRYLPDA